MNIAQLASDIMALESTKLPMEQSLERFMDVGRRIEILPDALGVKIGAKWISILTRNPGLKEIQAIRDNLAGQTTQLDPDRPLSPDEIVSFKYAPVTSCDVERSFSLYKSTLSDRRRNLTFENLRMILFVSSNSTTSDE